MPLGFWNVHLYHDPAACWTFPAEIVVRIPFPNGWREGENSRFLCRVNYWHHNAKRERTAKGFTWFYSIISKRRRNRRRLQCGSSDFGLFFSPRFRFDMLPDLGDVNRVQLPHPEILEALKPGKQLLPGRNCGRADELMLARGTTMLP